ncbi:MAG: hypothetical protein VYA84_00445 [Planctomycetota bacterium]|nr:hypothetical protein [Planctomycetota bacterium]
MNHTDRAVGLILLPKSPLPGSVENHKNLKTASGGDAMPESSCRPTPGFDPLLQDYGPLPGLIGSLRKKQQQAQAERSGSSHPGETDHDNDKLESIQSLDTRKVRNASEATGPAPF